MEEKLLEKSVKRYVLAIVDDRKYVKTMHWGKYMLVDDIEGATKFSSKKLAYEYLDIYKNDTGGTNAIVVPVIVTYELLG